MTIELLNKPDLALVTRNAKICYNKHSTELDPKLLEKLYSSKHLSTFEHVVLNLKISDVSRYLSMLLKMQKNYSASEMSQRYVDLSKDFNALDYDKHKEHYEAIVGYYNDLATRYPKEVARYILPISTYTTFAFTINLTTALRYIAMAVNSDYRELREFGLELENILSTMPELNSIVDKVKHEMMLDIHKEFSNSDRTNKPMQLDYEDVTDLSNGHYEDLNLRSLMYADLQSDYGFRTTYDMSIATYLQNQRHRTSKFHIAFNYGNRKYYIPKELELTDIALYKTVIEYQYSYARKHNDITLLPNAHNLSVTETVTYNDFRHKARERLCRTAQREIRYITAEQTKLLTSKGANTLFMPPCVELGKCNKGSFYCGEPVWKLATDINELVKLYKEIN